MSANHLTVFTTDQPLIDYLTHNGFIEQTTPAEAKLDHATFFNSPMRRYVRFHGENIVLESYGAIQFIGPRLPEPALWFWLDHKRMTKPQREIFNRLQQC